MSAATTPTPKVAIVIVNYQTADLIIEHFPALVAECGALPGAKVYIVDNASPNGDAARLRRFAQSPDARGLVTFIPSAENGGFAKGNNIALRRALPEADYVFLLNPDAYVRPGAIRTLVAFLEERPAAGIAGARLEHADGRPQISAFRFPNIASEFEAAARTSFVSKVLSFARVAPPQTDEAQKKGWLCGAGLLIRRAVFDDVGLFDEAYFLYYEETDFQRQAARKGWERWYVPGSRVVHLVGRSSGVIDGRRGRAVPPDYWYQSRAHYFRKNGGAICAAAADAAWLFGSFFYAVRAIVTRRNDADIEGVRAFLRNRAQGRTQP